MEGSTILLPDLTQLRLFVSVVDEVVLPTYFVSLLQLVPKSAGVRLRLHPRLIDARRVRSRPDRGE